MKVVYKITCPNNNIYVGKDRADGITYFGSASDALIAKDFTREQRRDFTIRREIPWEPDSASDAEVNRNAVEYILSLHANSPAIRYEQWPKFGVKPHSDA